MKKIMILSTLMMAMTTLTAAHADDQSQGQGTNSMDHRNNSQWQGQHNSSQANPQGNPQGNPQWQGQHNNPQANPQWQGQHNNPQANPLGHPQGNPQGNPQSQGHRTDDRGSYRGDEHSQGQWQGGRADEHHDGQGQWQGNRGFGDNHRGYSDDRHGDDHGAWQGQRFHAPSPYAHPHGYESRRWHGGDHLPDAYRRHQYYVDYRQYHLSPPPRGYQWIRVDNDVVLTAIATGVIASVIQGLYY